jgi:hypothetical protein
MPRAELNHSEIMPTFGAKSDENQIECGSIYCKQLTGKYDFNHIASALRLRVATEKRTWQALFFSYP